MTFIELLKVIFLGIVEGITEWLPISSTGHMILVDEFLQLDVTKEFKDLFFYAIQLGAIFAVIVIYWKKIWPFTTQKEDYHLNVPIMRMWVKVVVALIPSVLIALPFDNWMEEHFYNGFTVALMLIIYGVLFIWVETRNEKRHIKPRYQHLGSVTYRLAFLIGCFQALSIIPGTSRSGATILGAILLGCSRSLSAEFSFFMAIPTMFGASLLKLVKYEGSFGSSEILHLVLGMLIAFAVSYVAIKFLMNYIKKHDFKVFGYYRIVLGIIVLLFFGIQALVTA